MKRILCLLLGAALAILATPAAWADQYVVGVENIDYHPHYNGGGGQYHDSFAKALLDAFAADRGHQFTYRPLPIKRLFDDFLAGNLDLKYPDNAYWSGDQKKGKTVVYSDPVVPYIDGVMVPKDHLGQGLAALKTLGIVRGFTAWEYLGMIGEGKVKLAENSDYVALLKQTQAGRTDGAYGSVAVANWHLSHTLNAPGALVYDPDLPHTASNYHLSTIKHPELIQEFNQWLRDHADQVRALQTQYQVLQGIQ